MIDRQQGANIGPTERSTSGVRGARAVFVETIETGGSVVVHDLEREERWPHFTPRCLAATPVRSCLALPLLINGRTLGALDLYGERPDAFDSEQIAIGLLFALHAAVALEAATEREHLRTALASRDIIGQTKGILMGQSKLTSDEAFDLLRRTSQRLNEKLTVVAQRIVDDNNHPPSG